MEQAFRRPQEILQACVRDGDLDQLQAMAAVSPELLQQKSAWGTPLDVAVRLDNVAAAQILLGAGADPLDDRGIGDVYRTAMELAAVVGNRGISRLMWEHIGIMFPDGIVDNDYSGTTKLVERCLLQAASYGHAALIGDYLEWSAASMAPFTWSDMAKRAALVNAAHRWEADVVELLLASVPYEKTTLDAALGLAIGFKSMLPSEETSGIVYGDEDEIKQYRICVGLLNAGADANGVNQGVHHIHRAIGGIVLYGALEALLEKGVDPDARAERGRTALQLLTCPIPVHDQSRETRLHEKGIRLLLQKGASVSLGDDEGESPLHWAAMNTDRDIFLQYISYFKGITPVLWSTNHHGETLLHYAAAGGRYDTIELLISRGLDINAASENSWTPILCALAPTLIGDQDNGRGVPGRRKSEQNAVKSAKLLLFSGADTDVVTAEGWTILHVVGSYLQTEEQRADGPANDDYSAAGLVYGLLVPGSYDLPPINSPARGFDQLWLSRISEVTRKGLFGSEPWGYRVNKNLSLCAETETAVVKEGLTPLHWAAEHGAVGVARVLVDRGADLETRDSTGSTPLKLAAKSEFLKDHEAIRDAVKRVLEPGNC
ncbi:ankyrin repeat protein [Colletotrichum truncatum]|uniref:Ankyrin repeat protein n=1 Tax=Colletotrichum truncatum TaxID=5467 RepID=A0ACC3ZGQ5_COLTU|nr:ankyrin repeat protein [Colletotrichum truncatum]KAF6790417.1 ankyrin repeat protein [Colletotrichum truncatum]